MKTYGDLTVEVEEQKAEIERLTNRGIEDMKHEINTLKERLKVLQGALQRDIDMSWFTAEHDPVVDQALLGELES